MIRLSFFSAAVAILMSFCQGWSAHAAAPEEQLIEALKVALGNNLNTDGSGLDALPGIKWAPLPQTSHIEPQHQVAFSRRFGPLEMLYDEDQRVPGFPEIARRKA